MKLSRSSADGMDMTWQDPTARSNVAAAHLNRGVTSRHGK
jgi:hypothetical protein